MMGKWFAGWLLPMALSIAGCAGIHLHDVGNAKLAKDTSEAVTALGIDEAFARQTQVQKNLLDKQIELARSFALADRDATLARLALSEKTLREDWYSRDLLRRLTELGAGSLKQLRDAQSALKAAEQNLATAQSALNEIPIDTTCSESPSREVMTPQQLQQAARKALEVEPKPPSAKDIDDLVTLLKKDDKNFVSACKKYLGAQKHLKSLAAGELGAIDTKVEEKRAAIDAAAARRDKIAREFKMLDAAVESSAAGETDDKGTLSEKIKGRLDDARNLLKGVVGVSALFTERDIVEERLKRIDEALVLLGGTVPEGNDPPEARRKVAVAFAGMFEILDKLATLEKTAKTMPRTDLVIVRSELAARKVGIVAVITRYKDEIGFLEAERAAIEDEIQAYRMVEQRLSQADEYFKQAVAGTNWAGKGVLDVTYRELMKSTPSGVKSPQISRAQALLNRAVVLQVHARQTSTLAVAESRLRQAAAVHDASIVQAQANVAQWMAIIQPLVAQQEQYHAGGIKPEQLAALIFEAAKAAGLFAIAAGVN